MVRPGLDLGGESGMLNSELGVKQEEKNLLRKLAFSSDVDTDTSLYLRSAAIQGFLGISL